MCFPIRKPLRAGSRAALLLLAIVPISLHAQEHAPGPTGNLEVDLRASLSMSGTPDLSLRPFPLPIDEDGRVPKSPALGGLFSVIIPGTGQIYAEAPWWRTVLYGAVEAAGWTLYFVYDAKGTAATRDFENFADAHWDVTRYVDWIAANYQRWSDDSVNKQLAGEALGAIYVSSDPNLKPWERIDFEQLNKLEEAVKGGFSHTLPAHGEHQYYEEIGKYFQYRAGWDDHMLEGDTVIFNPSRVSTRNLDYVRQREDANALGSYAVTALGVVVLNHVVSAVDAILAVRHYNISIGSRSRGELLPNGRRRLVPAIGMTFRF